MCAEGVGGGEACWMCGFVGVCVLMEVFVSVCLLPKRLMSLSSRAEEHLRFPELTKKITAALLKQSFSQRPAETWWALQRTPRPTHYQLFFFALISISHNVISSVSIPLVILNPYTHSTPSFSCILRQNFTSVAKCSI